MDPRQNLLDDDARIGELIRSARRVAVLGIKTEKQADQAAFYVPEYLRSAGAEVIPVPVYYPEVQEILGAKVHRKLADVAGPIDIVDVFRRPKDIPPHVEDLKTLKPRAVWFQLGIRNDEAALALAAAGILVVQDRCLMVEWRRHR
ncbi:MAG TPA: CoA-binding protein [Anaeromyxobacteraceae bacterium]